MSKLFLFSLIDFFSLVSLEVIVLIANILIIFLSLVCVIVTIVKKGYGIKNRLWLVFLMVGVCLIQLWIELSINANVRYLFLTAGISICALSIILFLPQKDIEISEEGRRLARLFSDRAKNEREEKEVSLPIEKSKVFSSPIIKAEQRAMPVNNGVEQEHKREIDFSHVKSVLNKLEYYPLKEQDKKQAKDLENAIINAEENGMNFETKEKINDGLGALLKIMSKYAI